MPRTNCLPIYFTLMVVTLQPAEAHSRYPYLIEATNRVLALNALGSRVTATEAASAAKQSCDALGMLVKDELFASDLHRWEKNQFNDDRLAFKRDLGLFLNVFLVPEKSILDYAGFDENAQQRILLAAATTHASLDAKITADQVIGNIERLRGNICMAASRLDGTIQQQQVLQAIRRMGLGMIAVALIAADAPFIATGPPTIVAALSVAAGSVLLDRAIGDILPR